MACVGPAISSAVSPLVLRAVRKDAACTSLTWPFMMSSSTRDANTSSISSPLAKRSTAVVTMGITMASSDWARDTSKS